MRNPVGHKQRGHPQIWAGAFAHTFDDSWPCRNANAAISGKYLIDEETSMPTRFGGEFVLGRRVGAAALVVPNRGCASSFLVHLCSPLCRSTNDVTHCTPCKHVWMELCEGAGCLRVRCQAVGCGGKPAEGGGAAGVHDPLQARLHKRCTDCTQHFLVPFRFNKSVGKSAQAAQNLCDLEKHSRERSTVPTLRANVLAVSVEFKSWV